VTVQAYNICSFHGLTKIEGSAALGGVNMAACRQEVSMLVLQQLMQ
jgi:hypothetical protein